uniref:Uncharacterized protein LOC111108612 n=1 Tax=Crassostrea virginica TaxID=6565 RepID=A0A8B8BC15_CRAVI|nr:uncharacterized protein LOC111108612 [Crassostrea virginica]
MIWRQKNIISGLFTFFHLYTAVLAIDCYQCSSRNFSDPFCHDPFHPAYKNLTTDCGEGRESRVGLFPARYCTKIVGNNSVDKTEMVIRSCSIKSMDTICGPFNFENVMYTGCISSCETDACNGGQRASPGRASLATIVTAVACYLVTSVKEWM